MFDNKLKPIDLLVKRAADNGENFIEVEYLIPMDIAELQKLGYIVMFNSISQEWRIKW